MATSFWHINFSRIGFRAILVPFLATVGLYYLLKGLRRQNGWDLVLAGIFIGLGLHTYIAFRFVLFVLLVPLVYYLWGAWKKRSHAPAPWEVTMPTNGSSRRWFRSPTTSGCRLCAVAIFLFIAFVVALPIGIYFLQNPQDFLGRGGQVSIFSSESPAKEFVKSSALTLGMFFVRGDCNWRHNYNCAPALHPVVALFFLVGLITLFRSTFRRSDNASVSRQSAVLLLAWLFSLSLPATLTREGLAHALRTIGMIPAVMITAAVGAGWFVTEIRSLLKRKRHAYPHYAAQLRRIQREVLLLFFLILLMLPVVIYRDYFLRWAHHRETYYAFTTDLWHLGEYLAALPADTTKYVVANAEGVDVRGIPMPAQTVMFATNTFLESERASRRFIYLTPPEAFEQIRVGTEPVVIAFLNSQDQEFISRLQDQFPSLKPKAPWDFVVLQNVID